MKNTIYVLIAAALMAGGYYLYIYWALGNDSFEQGAETYATYSRSDIGLEFDYPEGPEGYVVEERIPADLGAGLVKNIILMRTEDAESEPPTGGEAPPAIAISVFKNTKKQFPRTWADENIQRSNINLTTGAVEEAVVGGANAIRYMTDGLYASENVVVAHGDHMYVVTGQFTEQDSPIRRDYQALAESIRFIPAPGQN
ncbi:MAG TPA: hypothetical protein VEB60_00875 [Candidatus Paceibacterota bacterium]|nr:hypothetical protein [Candidatus Paceibacterota bacterium]